MSVEPKNTKISRFDQVKLITSKNIQFVSAPPDAEPKPNGVWSVAGIIGTTHLLCVKENIVINVPINDVLKVGEYDVGKIYEKLGKLSHG